MGGGGRGFVGAGKRLPRPCHSSVVDEKPPLVPAHLATAPARNETKLTIRNDAKRPDRIGLLGHPLVRQDTQRRVLCGRERAHAHAHQPERRGAGGHQQRGDDRRESGEREGESPGGWSAFCWKRNSNQSSCSTHVLCVYELFVLGLNHVWTE